MHDWSWVPDRRLRRRLQASGLTFEDRMVYPMYLPLEAVAVLWEKSVSPAEYRRRIRAVGRTVRGYGGDQYDVAAAREIVVVAATHDVPFEDALDRLKVDGAHLAVLSIRAHVPVWFASHFYLEASDNPDDLDRFYQRLVTYRHSGPELVRTLLEDDGDADAETLRDKVLAWTSLRLPASTVRLLLQADMTIADVRANPRLATDLDALRLLATLQNPGNIMELMLQTT